MPLPTTPEDKPSVQWFDGFTKVVLSVMFVLLLFVFLSGKYMNSHRMAAGGTDDTVNGMASRLSGTRPHPFIELPGDAEVGAFSVANFCAGLIVGHYWSLLFGAKRGKGKNSSAGHDDHGA